MTKQHKSKDSGIEATDEILTECIETLEETTELLDRMEGLSPEELLSKKKKIEKTIKLFKLWTKLLEDYTEEHKNEKQYKSRDSGIEVADEILTGCIGTLEETTESLDRMEGLSPEELLSKKKKIEKTIKLFKGWIKFMEEYTKEHKNDKKT